MPSLLRQNETKLILPSLIMFLISLYSNYKHNQRRERERKEKGRILLYVVEFNC